MRRIRLASILLLPLTLLVSCESDRKGATGEEPDTVQDGADAADIADGADSADVADSTNAADSADSADGVDAADSADASDGADARDGSDQTDSSPDTVSSDVISPDVGPSEDADGASETVSDALDMDDVGDGTDVADSSDGSDGTDGSDSTDGQDSTDGPLPPCAEDSDCAGLKGAPCTTPKCKPSSGLCVLVDSPDNTPCTDADPCTSKTLCQQGICAGGTLLTCNDDEPCTLDICENETCKFTPAVGAPCSDGNPCTIGDLCGSGSCVSGGLKNCQASATGCMEGVCDSNTGTCGAVSACGFGQICDEATDACVDFCQGDCDGKVCGSDGCLGSCGICFSESCVAGACVECTAKCSGKVCGDDGCGGSCGTCQAGQTCTTGLCKAGCVPACDGKSCGDDGCGGSCGACAEGINCTVDSECGNACTTCGANAACDSFSFEAGLAGWAAETAAVIDHFGAQAPYDGGKMLLLGTHGASGAPPSEATVQFCAAAGKHTINFHWKLYSAEMLEYCGTQFQDGFAATLSSSAGSVKVVDLKIDDVCPEGSLGLTVTQSAIVLDQADVYETAWVAASGTIELAAPEVLTFTLQVTDVGDSIYDTVVLIDGITIDDPPPVCTPSCGLGVQCGDDGCGGSCGSCTADKACAAGVCIAATCGGMSPTAKIVIQEGEQVIPQTNLHLIGSQSTGFAWDSIQKYVWYVAQPPGSASVFVPSATFPNPTFEANVAGQYTFTLAVESAGGWNCVAEKRSILVIPDEAIHIELTWDTPLDPDQTDEGAEAGSDMDLHFVHEKNAAAGLDPAGYDGDGDGKPDVWFQQPWDSFWFNAHPNWGSFDPTANDDPGLDLDDTDGAGPENLNLAVPQNGTTYLIGAHYWSDHEFGTSFATVRIYVNQIMVAEYAGVPLESGSLWQVARLEWPSGKITAIQTDAGALMITPDYQNPFFLPN